MSVYNVTENVHLEIPDNIQTKDNVVLYDEYTAKKYLLLSDDSYMCIVSDSTNMDDDNSIETLINRIHGVFQKMVPEYEFIDAGIKTIDRHDTGILFYTFVRKNSQEEKTTFMTVHWFYPDEKEIVQIITVCPLNDYTEMEERYLEIFDTISIK